MCVGFNCFFFHTFSDKLSFTETSLIILRSHDIITPIRWLFVTHYVILETHFSFTVTRGEYISICNHIFNNMKLYEIWKPSQTWFYHHHASVFLFLHTLHLPWLLTVYLSGEYLCTTKPQKAERKKYWMQKSYIICQILREIVEKDV